MKSVLLVLFMFCILCGCSPSPQELKAKSEEERKDKIYVDSMVKAMKVENDILNGKVLRDTIGLSKSPVKITEASLVKREYGNYRDVRMSYKNISNKEIVAIKFMWKGIDAFGDPAEMGSHSTDGMGGGFTDEVLKPGETKSGTWEILSANGKTVTLAWPTEVVFKDGSKWKL